MVSRVRLLHQKVLNGLAVSLCVPRMRGKKPSTVFLSHIFYLTVRTPERRLIWDQIGFGQKSACSFDSSV